MTDATHHILYHYNPSVPVAVVATTLWTILTGYHFLLMYQTRARFLIPFFIGLLFETFGFAVRIYSAAETNSTGSSIGPYIIQQILIIVAPALFAGSIYMTLGRIILMADGEKYSVIKAKWLTKVFVCSDVVAFNTQSGGAGLLSSKTASTADLGKYIVMAGLAVQIISFTIFIATGIVFHLRIKKHPTARIQEDTSIPWERHLRVLYISSGLVFIRTLFRFIEFAQGSTGYSMTHEWFAYVFDTLLMLFMSGLLCWIHPGEIKQYLDNTKCFNREIGTLNTPIHLHQRLASDV